jgi:4'-phosphopantetheinyl transferase
MDLAADEIHVWRASLEVPARTLECLRTTLSADELTRAASFYFPRDRERFTAAHGIARNILGGYPGVRPPTLEFANNEYGKPALAGDLRDPPRFNLLHSGDCMLIAVARDREVGVDLEQYVADRGDLTVAEYYFSPAEVARLRAVPATPQIAGLSQLLDTERSLHQGAGYRPDGPARFARRFFGAARTGHAAPRVGCVRQRNMAAP